MKYLLTSILLILLSLSTYCQCDDAFFAFEEGKLLEYTLYNRDEQPQGIIKNEITSVTGTLAFIQTITVDNKGRTTDQETFTVSCDKGDIQIDINQYVPKKVKEKFSGKKVEIEGNFIVVPKNLSVNQRLPDGKIVMKIAADARTAWQVEVLIKNRLVEANETISTPVAEFEAFKIIEHVEIKVDMGSLQEFSSYYQSSWYVRGVGIVKKGRSARATSAPQFYELLSKIE